MTLNPSRRSINRQRRELNNRQRRFAASQACLHLLNVMPRLPQNAKIGIYLDAFGELPTQPIVDWCQRCGYSVFLPVINSFGNRGQYSKVMRFAKVNRHKLSTLVTVPHALGMQQYQQRKLYWAHELDAIFCPLVAADLQGNRMGMGGGFYDSTLAASYNSGCKWPLRIGWCYEFQVVKKLQTQPWDVPLDALITPKNIRWFKPNHPKNSSATYVNNHLQQIEHKHLNTQTHQLTPEEQRFTESELAGLLNSQKFNSLMASSNELVDYLTAEIDKFIK